MDTKIGMTYTDIHSNGHVNGNANGYKKGTWKYIFGIKAAMELLGLRKKLLNSGAVATLATHTLPTMKTEQNKRTFADLFLLF